MKITHMTALCLLAFDAAAAFAHTPQATDASRMKALQAQVTALQQQVNELRASMLAAKPAGAATTATAASGGAKIGSINTAAAAAPAADAAPAFTNDDLQQMREQIANASLKVDSLQEAATTGPLAGLSITGYVDPVYLFNRAQRTSGFQFLNHDPGAYDYFNSTIGDVYLDIKKTFGVGPMAPAAEVVIQPNRGFGSVFSNAHGGIGNNIVTQAVVTVPLSTTRTFEIGMMPSLAGYEVQPSTQMLTLTHGLLYDFSEPGNLIGVGLKSQRGDDALLAGRDRQRGAAHRRRDRERGEQHDEDQLDADDHRALRQRGVDRLRLRPLRDARPAVAVLAVRAAGRLRLPVQRRVADRPLQVRGSRRDLYARQDAGQRAGGLRRAAEGRMERRHRALVRDVAARPRSGRRRGSAAWARRCASTT